MIQLIKKYVKKLFTLKDKRPLPIELTPEDRKLIPEFCTKIAAVAEADFFSAKARA